MTLRRHQQDLLDHVGDVISGAEPIDKPVVLNTTPAGGKSACGQIVTRLIDAGLIDGVCIVTPRQSLQDQAARDFQDKFMRSLLGHSHSINISTNEIDPCRGTSGYATTYQAIASDSGGINAYEFMRKKYAIVLDEVHHVAEGGTWHTALQPLIEQAAFVLFMSGTLYRGDNKPIAFLPYIDIGDGLEVDFGNSGFRFINYSRVDALAENAILPVEFHKMDGEAEWMEPDGTTSKVRSLSDSGGDCSKAVFTAVRTDFAFALLDKSLAHYLPFKQVNSNARLLVVSPNISMARQHRDYLISRSIPCEIATSNDTKQASDAIREFRYGSLDVLVTVGMAYEGLDVPAITHVVCLTTFRSRPWLEQCFARAVRVDKNAGPYSSQMAYVFAPDDPLMNRVIEDVREQQSMFVQAQLLESGDRVMASKGEGSGRNGEIIPVSSCLTRSRVDSLDSQQELSYQETSVVERLLRDNGLDGTSVLQIASLLVSLGYELSSGSANDDYIDIPVTPAEQMMAVRKKIESHIRAYEYENGIPYGNCNKRLKRMFGKGRPEMNLDELLQQWECVRYELILEPRVPQSAV